MPCPYCQRRQEINRVGAGEKNIAYIDCGRGTASIAFAVVKHIVYAVPLLPTQTRHQPRWRG
ncbi:hypothetical protein [Microseira wollei]|uniref:hypothetical protein n=1 Tax=Microseira wollei TaxID=467598 RepID=UPI001CFDD9E1|nr:hypothetical protein [Microseira wollei]